MLLNAGDDQVMRFHGNTSHRDHFKLLEMNGDFLLVGARNIVYNISIHNMTENPQHVSPAIRWQPRRATT